VKVRFQIGFEPAGARGCAEETIARVILQRKVLVEKPRQHPHPEDGDRVVVPLGVTGGRGFRPQRLGRDVDRRAGGGGVAQTIERKPEVRLMIEPAHD